MKIRILTILWAAMTMWACSSVDDNVVIPDAENPAQKEFMVSIGLKGEINLSEAPLSRAESTDLYGIQVYSRAEGETNYKEYAYGLFESTEGLQIKLIAGYYYKFMATKVVDGQNKIWSVGGAYGAPFKANAIDENKLTDGFIYSSTHTLVSNYPGGITTGNSFVTTENGFESFTYPNIDRYYGETTEDYTPSENGSISINMKRTVFGLKVVAENLEEGILSIAMAEAPEMKIEAGETTVEDIFTFNHVSDAFTYNDTENPEYSETIAVTFIWTNAKDVNVPMGTHNITFKRLKQTIVTIDVKDVTNIENNFGITLENGNVTTGDRLTLGATE